MNYIVLRVNTCPLHLGLQKIARYMLRREALFGDCGVNTRCFRLFRLRKQYITMTEHYSCIQPADVS